MKRTHPTHLIDFTVENYRSIREPVTLSMVATPKHDRNADFRISNGKRLLTSAVVYGANASGKSNLMHALFLYRETVIGNNQLFGKESAEPFMLDELSKTRHTTFEASFEYDERLYIYGFQVSTQAANVSGEWLRVSNLKSNRLTTVYERKRDSISINKNLTLEQHGISQTYSRQVQSQELFITTLSRNANWTIAQSVVQAWQNCHVLNTLYHDPFQMVAKSLYEQPATKDLILPLLQEADLTVRDIQVTRNDADEYQVKLQHSYVTNKSVRSVWFDIHDQESAGTFKLFCFALPLLLSLRDGSLMILDELGSTLHPDLLQFIVRLFHNPKRNQYHAQLIVTTHDTTLMSELLARDQVYFVNKTAAQTTELYALSDIRGVLKDRKNMDRRYLRGDFGAVPNIVED